MLLADRGHDAAWIRAPTISLSSSLHQSGSGPHPWGRSCDQRLTRWKR